MDELLVIISAELILLVSIVAMMIHNRSRSAAAPSHRRSDVTDYAGSDKNRTKQARPLVEREKLRPRAPSSREQTMDSPSWQRRWLRPIAPGRADAGDFANRSLENQAQFAEQLLRQFNDRRGRRAPASLPQGIRIYAIGDIHGRADLLSRLLRCIEVDRQARPVERALTVFIGDYIDRGLHSRDVIDLLLRWRESNDAIFLRGNHETFLPKFLSDSKTLDEWRKCGGLETLLSYGLQPSISPDREEQERLAHQLASSLPKEHFQFLESLEPFYDCGDFLFVHAGIRPGIPIDEQAEEDLLWIREEFLACEQPFERLVVHGHTPVEAPEFRSNRINIDTGAFATGRLTCIVIEGSGVTHLQPAVDVGAFSAP
jgi:diadenosine tetraphosphatase ApaH/serine/threonine PP2A family protein phosphatase